MKAEDYIDTHLISIGKDNEPVITEEDALEAIDIAKRELAEYIRNMIINFREQHTKGDITSYIQVFCEGIMDF